MNQYESPVDSRRAKLAGSVATQIISDVIDMGWPVGEVIGSESDLVERYGVSRAVFREAVRLVEHQHVARMRRGPGGGLVVDEPDIDSVIGVVVLYMLRVDASLDEVFEARVVLEEMVAELSPGRVGEEQIAEIRAILAAEKDGSADNHRRLHAALASATENPVLDLFVETLNRVAVFYFNDPDALSPDAFTESVRAHERIAAAVVSNDPGLAKQRMGRHLRAEAKYISSRPDAEQILDASVALSGSFGTKRTEAVARGIIAEVVGAHLPPDTFMGSEAEMMERHGASRAVLREALRVLEHHNVVLMRRGPRGGLYVAEPDASAVADMVAIYLRRKAVTPQQLAEVRTGMELEIIDRVARNLRPADCRRIEEVLNYEAEYGYPQLFSDGRDLHALLAELSGNRALELICKVVLQLTGVLFHQGASTRISPEQLGDVDRAHRLIGDALAAGDRDLASHRMRRHLAALDPSRGLPLRTK